VVQIDLDYFWFMLIDSVNFILFVVLYFYLFCNCLTFSAAVVMVQQSSCNFAKSIQFHVLRQQEVTITTQNNNIQFMKTTFVRWPG